MLAYSRYRSIKLYGRGIDLITKAWRRHCKYLRWPQYPGLVSKDCPRVTPKLLRANRITMQRKPYHHPLNIQISIRTKSRRIFHSKREIPILIPLQKIVLQLPRHVLFGALSFQNAIYVERYSFLRKHNKFGLQIKQNCSKDRKTM